MSEHKDIFNNIKVAIENATLPFNILGVIAFGSRVKGRATLHSDFDLLIVADGIHPKRQRRGEEILLIKRCLPSVPLDIILLSPEEVISNFKNHNPLFLDIAEEGIVMLDKDNFLSSLISDTKDYIKARGIQRSGEGWRFPVNQRIPTPLSKVTNKDFAMAMFKDGERDSLIARKLIDEGFYDKSVYHCQQSIEKCIKSILITFGVFQKTHFVGEILVRVLEEQKISEQWKEKLLEVAEISEMMEPEVTLSRYPGIREDGLWVPFEEYEREDAERAMERAKKVILITKDFLNSWFMINF